MSFSYGSDPVTNRLATVRMLIGDTDSADVLLTDEEIEIATKAHGNNYAAAALCCRAIAGKFARQVQFSLEGISAARQQRFEHYLKLAETYEGYAARGGAPTLYAGGTEDATERAPIFDIGIHDNPGPADEVCDG